MIFKTKSNPSCEISILTNNTELMSICKNRVLRIETELWLTLQSKSSWIYCVNKPTIAEISTEYGKKYQTELRDTGIITLIPGSKLETISVKIGAPANSISEIEIKFVAGSKIPVFDFNTTEIKINIPDAPKLITSTTLSKLKKITKDIADLEVQQEIPLLKMLKENNFSTNLWISSSAMVLFVIILFIIWRLGCCPSISFCCKICRSCCRRRSTEKQNTNNQHIEIGRPEIIHMPEMMQMSEMKSQIKQETIYEVPINIQRETQSVPRTQPPPVPKVNNQRVQSVVQVAKNMDSYSDFGLIA